MVKRNNLGENVGKKGERSRMGLNLKFTRMTV